MEHRVEHALKEEADDLLGALEGNAGVVHPEDLLGPGPGSEQGEDAGAAAHVQHVMFFLVDGVPVGESPDGVLQHGLVDEWLGVGAVVIVLAFLLLILQRTVNLASTACSLGGDGDGRYGLDAED